MEMDGPSSHAKRLRISRLSATQQSVVLLLIAVSAYLLGATSAGPEGISSAIGLASDTRTGNDDPVQRRLDSILGPYDPRDLDSFTIVTPSFKREPILPKFLDTYAKGDIPSLSGVVIQWADVKSSPSISLVDSLANYPVPIVIVRPSDDSLNERFRTSGDYTESQVLGSNTNILNLRRTAGILSIDDDILVEAMDVELAFQTWRDFGGAERKRMVGYFPREVLKNGKYHWKEQTTYSMILTKAAFLHRDWIQAYWAPELEGMRKFVHDGRNCEDILMSFLVASHTHLPPIHFEAKTADSGEVGENAGISAGGNHNAKRDKCIVKFKEYFGSDTLVSSAIHVKGKGRAP